MSSMNGSRDKIILVVEDNIANRNLIELGLMEGGVECCAYYAGSAEEADRQLEEIMHDKKQVPDIILLDNKLPGTDGMDYLLKLRKTGPTVSVPVIVMTATDNPDDIRKAYNNGANSCLDKPMEFDRMARTIKAVSKYWLVHNRHP